MDERDADEYTVTPIFSRMALSFPTVCSTSTPRRRSKNIHHVPVRAKSFPNAMAGIERNTAMADNQRQSLNLNKFINNNPFKICNTTLLTSTACDIELTPTIMTPKRHGGNWRRRLSTAGNRRKSILTVRRAQTRLRMAFRSKTKQQRTERFLDQRLTPIENDKSCASSHDSDEAVNRFEVLLSDKCSQHPYERDETKTLNGSANFQSSSPKLLTPVTPETSSTFRSSKSSYCTLRLRKIPQIKQDKTPMRLTSAATTPKIQLCDLLTWNRYSDSLKLLLIIIGVYILWSAYVIAHCTYYCK